MFFRMQIDQLIRQAVEQVNIHAFRACFGLETSDGSAKPSRASFSRSFEHAMKRLSCTCGGEAVREQRHDHGCPYDRLLNRERPPRFVLHYSGEMGSQHDRLTVEFALLGDTVQLLPLIILALDDMELGMKDAEIARPQLLEVLTIPDGNRIYDGRGRKLDMAKVVPSSVRFPEDDGPVSSVMIRFVYPIDLIGSGSNSVIPRFTALIECLWRRLSILCPDSPSIKKTKDDPGLREAMEHIKLDRMKLKWRKTPRSDCGGSVKTGGVVGQAVYIGSIAPFMPLLRMGEWIGVDNGSWMNMGRIRVEVNKM